LVYLMGVDIGTSTTKVLVIDEQGEPLAKASREYPISAPCPSHAEQNAEWWWNATIECMREVLRKDRVNPNEIIAIGLSGQMHGTVLLGRDLKPLRPAIIWADRRSSAQCTRFYEIVGRKKVLDIICNPAMPGFMGPTLLWVKENEPRIFRETRKVLLPKDYVRLQLTGSLGTDISDASATLLFDVRRRGWSSCLSSQLGFPDDLFPEIFDSVDVAGELATGALGLPRGIPVVAGGGDSVVGAVGCGVIREGVVSSNIGTGGQVFVTLDNFRVDRQHRVHTFCHAVPGKWCLQGAILSAGLSLRWFRDSMGDAEKSEANEGNIDPYDLLSKEAESAEPGCNGLVFLPYLLGERSPHMDPEARGGFFGLTFQHRKAHMVRAIMEGVAYALRDCLVVFQDLGVTPKKIIARGGGARSPLWRQIQADIFNVEITRTRVEEEAAYGAALLAGVGAGVYSDLEEACAKTVQVASTDSPNNDRVKLYDSYYHSIYRKLYPALRGFWPKTANDIS